MSSMSYMTSPPSSLTFTTSRSPSGKLHTENENTALSPKRSLAQLEEDQLSQPELKRRDVHSSKRAPLDPLSAYDLENRPSRGSRSIGSGLHHALNAQSSVSGIPILHPEQLVSSGSCEMQCSVISDFLVCSWPPHTVGSAGSSHSSFAGRQASQCVPQHSLGEKMPSRATFLESTSAWGPSDSSTGPIAAMTKPIPTTGWKSESLLQPIRPRTTSVPSVRLPPKEPWQSDSASTKVDREPVDMANFFTPPGLPAHRPESRRSGPTSDLLPHGSVSLSLALGSQPLNASEHAKVVPPIGAERSRVTSITSLKACNRNSPATLSHDHSKSPTSLSPALLAKCRNGTHLSNDTLPYNVQATAGGASKEDLERLLRNAVRNKHAPKIISPLSPLRTSTPAFELCSDPAYQLCMPAHLNNPSPRYFHCPPRRARMICDGHQTFDWNATCMHCQECKRDSLGKRLLAFRFRQQQIRHVQRNRLLLVYPPRVAATSVMNDDRIVLANRIRDVFAYELDEEEKSLWAEVAAITGAGPIPFSRAGAPCGAATHRRMVDAGSDDGVHDDYLEVSDDGLPANESATLFREVSVY